LAKPIFLSVVKTAQGERDENFSLEAAVAEMSVDLDKKVKRISIEIYQTAAAFAAGLNPPSYDKQFVRDWLEAVRINGKPWDKTPPAPRLPDEVIAKTAAKYQEALTRLMA
jgi:phosphoribosylaminoimidazole-succinocarboxamide synthase